MTAVFKLKKVVLCLCAVSLCALLGFAAYATGAYAVYLGATPRLVPIYRVAREDKYVSISFDCAWGVEHTDAILKALDACDVKCTFFAVVFWTEKYPG